MSAMSCRFLITAVLGLFALDDCRAQVFYSVVSADGRQNWLLGTIHAEDERVLKFPPVLEQALKQADTVALELVPRPETLEQLSAAMRLPEGKRLSERLDEDLYNRVAAALSEYGLESEALDRLRPWAAALTLAQPPVETGRFMDLVLVQRAAEHGAQARALETMSEQLTFFTGLGEQMHIALLEAAVADHERGGQEFEALIEAYLAADLAELRALAESQLSELPPAVKDHFRCKGIVKRNLEMARRARPLLEQGGTLIAVGALHLPGEKGLVALLREQGNQVKAIY